MSDGVETCQQQAYEGQDERKTHQHHHQSSASGDAIDKQLREEQAGFQKGRGCVDHIFTLRNIIEQCTEWQRQLYINFVDFEKAFDSIHRDSLWRILEQVVLLIRSFYTNFTCQIGNSFAVKTGVRQGCVMSALLLNLVMDWVMRRATEDKPRDIRWTQLEDLNFTDDVALFSHTHTNTCKRKPPV